MNTKYFYQDAEIRVEWKSFLKQWEISSPATENGWEGVTYSATYSSVKSPSAKQLADKIKGDWR
jgi:hypothetical protein